jgi:chemotaxis signal transduction protein
VTSPFRSTSGLAARRRVRPIVERATFVVVSQGSARYAFPVHTVERVLRHSGGASQGGASSIAFANLTLVLRDLASMLSLNEPPAFARTARVLVLRNDMSRDTSGASATTFSAVAVDEVHDVLAVETALIEPVMASTRTIDAPGHPAVRACFVRNDEPVWVLDPARLHRDAA